MAIVLHLNGVPGVGKSTLARRWAEQHPGTLLLDIDALRTWVGGWRDDFAATGALIRPIALAMVTAAAAQGQDVVLPQLIARPEELARFRDAAEAGGAVWAEVILQAPIDQARRRLRDRATDEPWLAAVRDLVEADLHRLDECDERLAELAATTPGAILLDVGGEVAPAYDALVAGLAGLDG